ncbi:GSCOCG00007627001-RA-CDS [Cotesia congregata]|nr:GSCOCG00007627001-RA-CDS [Cotesia congregata]
MILMIFGYDFFQFLIFFASIICNRLFQRFFKSKLIIVIIKFFK